MKSNYNRVNRQRTCLICGKPDWCSFTPDGKVSFCARISLNADRISRTGWGIFFHEQSLFGNPLLHFPPKPLNKKVALAPIEIRDFASRKLIELSPADKCQTIIQGSKGLQARKILNFHNYGFLPAKQNERDSLAKIIRCAINQEFPGFVKSRKTALSGIPGFWIDKHGNSRLWLGNDCHIPMLLIPYCNENNLIQACQIRYFGKIENDSPRYVWLSTPSKSSGVGSGSPLHFVSYSSPFSQRPLLVTEGALKAATTHLFKPQYDILANAGVACSHSLIIEAAKFRPILLGFDIDYFKNVFVALSLANLINKLSYNSSKNIKNDIRILTWNPKYPGIDDAFLNQTSLDTLTVSDWFLSLPFDFQTTIKNSLNSPYFLN